MGKGIIFFLLIYISSQSEISVGPVYVEADRSVSHFGARLDGLAGEEVVWVLPGCGSSQNQSRCAVFTRSHTAVPPQGTNISHFSRSIWTWRCSRHQWKIRKCLLRFSKLMHLCSWFFSLTSWNEALSLCEKLKTSWKSFRNSASLTLKTGHLWTISPGIESTWFTAPQ